MGRLASSILITGTLLAASGCLPPPPLDSDRVEKAKPTEPEVAGPPKIRCPPARSRRPLNGDMKPLSTDAIVAALPLEAGRFERGEVVKRTQGDLSVPRDTRVATYYGGKGANARFTVVDLLGECHVGDGLDDWLYDREVDASMSHADELEVVEVAGRRTVHATGYDSRVLTAFLGDRCRVVLSLEYGDSRDELLRIWSSIDLDALEQVCRSR